ncbi:hypothetical protein JVU11DRAFT_3576 [Chiua virens]|nr:hypothetical protein JVU11DRAFT_3576 [Chiua virens]
MSTAQSLPSFAQAFSNSSLSEITHISNALPPIQSRPAHSPSLSAKKRPRDDPHRTCQDAHNADTTRQSPILVRIKEEDRDDAQRPPQSPPRNDDVSQDDSTTPAPLPSSKKRRVTVSGAPSLEQATPVPISPAVSSFPIADDAVPRPILKQQPKSLVDQRRESISAALSAATPSPMVSGSLLSNSPPHDQLSTSVLVRIGRISPSAVSVARCAGNPVASGSQLTTSSVRPLTPPPLIVSGPALTSSQTTAEQAPKPQQVAATHSLPPPPISFARRRAAQPGGRKKKPADIVISPCGPGTSDLLAPVIQSAPPVADPGRFPMAIPRLPLALNNAQPTRRVAGNVPPTPTRFSLQGTAAPSISSTVRSNHSPPNPSVPIANTLVPPTPAALHHPGYTGDKSAFLAPFERFYDALQDSKQLKSWLSDQLSKSNSLIMSLKQQQEKMDEIMEDLVEKRTRAMREEITMLRQRMESLEEALLAVRAEGSTREQDPAGYGYPQGSKFHQNGVPSGSEPTSSYRFPAPEQRRPDTIIKVTSSEREREHQASLSPPVDTTRRLSVSAATARAEAPQGLHSSFGLAGHNRSSSGSQGSAKNAPLVRPQVPERTSTARQTDSRTAQRLFFTGPYGNSNPPSGEGATTSRSGDKS